MGGSKTRAYYISLIINLLLLLMPIAIDSSTTLKDVFSGVQKDTARVPRENKYYNTRYGSAVTPINRAIKPEDDRSDHQQAPLEKRCVRCETGYYDSRSYYPYDSRSRYDERRYRDRFDDYDSKYYDRRYDRYDDRDRDRERDRDRDRERDRYYGDRYYIDRYNYDRKPIDYGYDREKDKYDRYDRDRYYDRYYDRGVGYDNRGYDYRDRTDREGYRPWDETYRGSSGFDGSGRGYYFATGRPDYGYGGGNGYASNWNYGHGGGGGGGGGYGGRDDYYNRDSGYGHYRPRDPYDGGYRSTSYLYGRPSTTTTNRPNTSENDSVTQNPQQDNNTSG